jgi:hypothetical protein
MPEAIRSFAHALVSQFGIDSAAVLALLALFTIVQIWIREKTR